MGVRKHVAPSTRPQAAVQNVAVKTENKRVPGVMVVDVTDIN
jgi:hypothetical protein